MKPRFALDLSNDAISLLERRAEGWTKIGDAVLSDPRLDRRLAELRSKAELAAPEGFFTKLILPNSQILYLTVEAPGPDTPSRKAQIRAALDGRTPYAVDDLAFDWSGGGPAVKVAVLARETLDEAEDFAQVHGFRPAAFVAAPEDGMFGGEPFFGLTDVATLHLPEGVRYDRDQDPVRIAGEAFGETAPDADTREADAFDAAQPEDVSDGLQEAEADAENAPSERIEAEAAEFSAAEPTANADAAPFAADEDEGGGEDRTGPDDGARAPSEPDPVAAAGEEPHDVTGPDLPPAEDGPSLPSPGFQSRRVPGQSGHEGARIADIARRLGGFGATPSEGPTAAEARSSLSRFLVTGARPVQGPRDEPLPGTRTVNRIGAAAVEFRARARGAALSAQRAGAAGLNRLGERLPRLDAAAVGAVRRDVFGGPQAAMADRRRLGVGAVIAAGLVAATVALWSLVFSGEPGPVVQTAAVPPAAEAETRAPPSGLETAGVAKETAGAEPDLAAPGVVTTAPPEIPGSDTDDAAGAVALASDDQPEPVEPELPQGNLLAGDAPLPSQPLPQPYGTAFTYDPDGLIEPTAEGVVTPGGFTLIAGRPPLQPPSRPALAVGPAPTPQAPDPLAGKLPRARPAGLAPPAATDGGALNPEASAAELAALGPVAPPVDPRHAARKPLSRPAGITIAALAAKENAARMAEAADAAARAEAEAFEAALKGATAQAVASSRRPAARPAGIAALAAAARVAATPQPAAVDGAAVEAALAEAQAGEVAVTAAPAPEPPPADLDEPEPEEGIATLPTTRTVAKKSTIANAIDLGEINLIGVYGSSANRRALVRMPSGRYVKVQVGDRLDGGEVAAIGDSQLSYVKRGKTIVLKILKDS